MILYNEKDGEKILFIKCSCGTHGIQLQKFDYDKDPSSEIYMSIYTDNFYAYGSQSKFFTRLKKKIHKIWHILIGKDYKIDYEICLSPADIDSLIKGLKQIKE